VNRPSTRKRGLVFVRDLVQPLTAKTRAAAEGGDKKGGSYKVLPTVFRRNEFDFRQIARERNAAIYQQRWIGSAEPSICYEVIRIRRRTGFEIGDRVVAASEFYPSSKEWGAHGWTFPDRNNAFRKLREIVSPKPGGRLC